MPRRIRLGLICAIALCAVPASAQFHPRYDDARVLRMLYTNTGGEQGTSTMYYGRDGALIGEFWTLDDGSRWSGNCYVLDELRRPVEKYRTFSDSLTSLETFAHDDAGRRISETFERSDGPAGTATYRWSDDGRLLSAQCENWKGWLTCGIEYAHDGDRLASARITSGDRQAGGISYRYDADGHLLSETWDFGGRWSQTFTYEYEPEPKRIFDASSPLLSRNPRYRVSAENYDFDGKSGGPSHYEYGPDGRLLRKIFERDDGLRTETTFVFDGSGNLVSSHRAYDDGRTADFTYEYDAARRLAGKTFRRSDGAEGSEQYGYDRFGRLASASYRNLDFWLNGTITFAYDDRGHLSGGRFTAATRTRPTW